MVGNPLETCIGKDEVECAPQNAQVGTCVAQRKRQVRKCALSRSNHRLGAVNSQYVSSGKANGQCLCAVTRSAPDIEHCRGAFLSQSVNQVKCGLCPLLLEFQILVCIPFMHRYRLQKIVDKTGRGVPAGNIILYAVTMLFAFCSPSFSTACSRILYFRILPAAFIGNSSTKSM